MLPDPQQNHGDRRLWGVSDSAEREEMIKGFISCGDWRVVSEGDNRDALDSSGTWLGSTKLGAPGE